MAKADRRTDPTLTLVASDGEVAASETNAVMQFVERDGQLVAATYTPVAERPAVKSGAVEYDVMAGLSAADLAGRTDQPGDELLVTTGPNAGRVHKLVAGGDPENPDDWRPDIDSPRLYADEAARLARTGFDPLANEEITVVSTGYQYRIVDPTDATQDQQLSAFREDDSHGPAFPTGVNDKHLHQLYHHTVLPNGQYIYDAANDTWEDVTRGGVVQGGSSDTGAQIVAKIDAELAGTPFAGWKNDANSVFQTEEFVVNAAILAARSIALTNNPADGSIEVAVRGAPTLDSPRDWEFAAPNGVTWAGKGLEGILQDGDIIDVTYRV